MKTYLKTIIIGGGGFIGINLTKLLLKNNRNITIICKNNFHNINSNVKVIKNDCSDANYLKKIFYKADEIINLAYNSVPKTSYEHPINDIYKNLPFTINIFQAAAKSKINKFINLSTGGAIYGKQYKYPIKESQSLKPVSPYAITKLAIENYSNFFKLNYGLPVINLRPANAYGFYQKPYIGQGIIATLINSIIQNKQFNLYGENIIRDYLFIDDLVQGIKDSLEKGKIGATYNLGTGIGTSNLIVLKKIIHLAKLYKFKIPAFKIFKNRKFDVEKNILDSSKIYKDTGWETKINLDKGLKITWKWYLNNQK